MSVFVVGSNEPTGILAAALAELGVEAEAHRIGAGPGGGTGELLAAALTELEQLVTDAQPQAVVAVGPGDAAAAAALVAGKAGIPLISVLDDAAALADEARAITVLSTLCLPLPHDGPAVEKAAREIAAELAAAKSGA
jgi:succinyl-CoA synthetase alpha subunit